MTRRVLVVGGNRGIGLELVRQLRGLGHEVVATCRGDVGGLEAIEGVEIETNLDVATDHGWGALAGRVGKLTDVFVNAGIYLDEGPIGGLDLSVVLRDFEVNALGALRATQAALPAMEDGAKLVLITSRMGSIADNDSGGSYGYRMSKAALNAAGKSLSIDLRPRRIAVAIVHPGWVKTDMTDHRAPVEPRDSVAGILARWAELTLATSGTFWHMNGQVLPW